MTISYLRAFAEAEVVQFCHFRRLTTISTLMRMRMRIMRMRTRRSRKRNKISISILSLRPRKTSKDEKCTTRPVLLFIHGLIHDRIFEN